MTTTKAAQTAGRRMADFSADEIRVIRERRFGWEGATYELLARVFQTTPQIIGRICRAEARANG